MFFIIGWCIFGLICGTIAKLLHPGEDPIGFLPTIGIGVAGSFIGGFINWALGSGGSPLSTSGIFMSIIGGVVFCYLYSWYKKSSAEKN